MRILIGTLLACAAATATEFHVAPTGNDTHPGTAGQPFQTISAAAQRAQAGDTITVHAGIYRERVNPPRGHVVYQAAPGEKAIITGSEIVKNWKLVTNDTWRAVLPNTFFGGFNPYSDLIRGDWCGNPRGHHTGCVYLNGDWLIEADRFDDVLKPAGKTPLWFAKVDGASTAEFLVNIAWFKVGAGEKVPAAQPAARYGTQDAACSEGGSCVGFIRTGHWLRYDGVDFGAGSDRIELRVASQVEASEIEIRLGDAAGELLGTAKVAPTGDWQKWVSVPVNVKPTAGKRNLCLVFQPPRAATDNTTIWAQFPGANPNEATVEINVRKTVFTPEQTGINHITVRGFTLRHAASNWAPPSAAQIGLVSAYWCKGWLIESNEVAYSKCSGIALGKYGDEFDNTNQAGTADPYTACVRRALTNGWNKATVGSHVVRRNHIHHCEQAGIVGSMGGAFSQIVGNEIHDIWLHRLVVGAEQAGIKLHAAVDTEIRDNRVYRCGNFGLWLDWMAQGTRVIGNVMHDNQAPDIFLEVNHGPFLVANNVLLSGAGISTLSHGGAFVHNLVTGRVHIERDPYGNRATPCLQPHATDIVRVERFEIGDDRWINNLLLNGNLAAYDGARLPVLLSGNVLGNQPGIRRVNTADGLGLEFALDKAAMGGEARPLVTTALLGKTALTQQAFTLPDGMPMSVDTDYFGATRNPNNPFPGPFELIGESKQTLTLWPKP